MILQVNLLLSAGVATIWQISDPEIWQLLLHACDPPTICQALLNMSGRNRPFRNSGDLLEDLVSELQEVEAAAGAAGGAVRRGRDEARAAGGLTKVHVAS
jgi:hypothetical protein